MYFFNIKKPLISFHLSFLFFFFFFRASFIFVFSDLSIRIVLLFLKIAEGSKFNCYSINLFYTSWNLFTVRNEVTRAVFVKIGNWITIINGFINIYPYVSINATFKISTNQLIWRSIHELHTTLEARKEKLFDKGEQRRRCSFCVMSMKSFFDKLFL